MSPSRSACSLLVVIGLGLAVSAPTSLRAEEPVPSAAPSATPSPPRAEIALYPRIVHSAAAFLFYVRSAGSIDPLFSDGGSVARGVRVGAAYEAAQFQEGAIAYAAIVALREPGFVAGVRQALAASPARASTLAADLAAAPSEALRFQDADLAARRAAAALRLQGERLLDVGQRVKQASYSTQRAAWAKADVPQAAVRLAAAKSLSATPVVLTPTQSIQLLNESVAAEGAPAPQDVAQSPVVVRGVAIAALAAAGLADREAAVERLVAGEAPDGCLKMSKLNLFQCLAVAGPHYEDIFCLGQHALIDTAQCVIAVSGRSRPKADEVVARMGAPAPGR